MPDSPFAGLLALGCGIAIGVGFVIAGALRLVRSGLALKGRLDGYAALPLLREIEGSQARLALGTRAIDRFPSLQLRAVRALEEIAVARDAVRRTLFTMPALTGLLLNVIFDKD
jgi:hypothetical protein